MSATSLFAHPLRARAARGRAGGQSTHWLIAALLALLLAQQVAVLHRLGHALVQLPDAGVLALALANPGANLGQATGTATDSADGPGSPGAESATCLDCLAIGALGVAPPPAWQQALPPPTLTEVRPIGWLRLPAGTAPWRAQARGPPAD
jgi:hypothetical protein